MIEDLDRIEDEVQADEENFLKFLQIFNDNEQDDYGLLNYIISMT